MKGSLAFLFAIPTLAVADDHPPISTDRPGFSDSSNVVGRGTFQIESGIFRTYAQGMVSGSTGDFLLRYGTSQDFELRLIGLTYGFAPGGTQGLLDPSIGFKYRIQRQSGRKAEITFVGQSTVPIGASLLRANAWNPTAIIAWTIPVGGDSLGGNLVYSRNGDVSNRFDQAAVSLFYSKPLNATLSLTGEVWGVNRIAAGDSGGAYAGVAATYLATSATQLDLRIATGLNQTRDGWFLQSGISWRF